MGKKKEMDVISKLSVFSMRRMNKLLLTKVQFFTLYKAHCQKSKIQKGGGWPLAI